MSPNTISTTILSAGAPTRFLGVSQPISTDFPSPKDLQRTHDLLESLKTSGSFESASESKTRTHVLARMNQLVKRWIQAVTKARIPNGESVNAGGKLIAFGSYRLNVHSSGSDIDTLVVAPRHVCRSDFFSSFKDMLLSDKHCKDVVAVENAFVPIITCTYGGIDLDLLFAQMDLPAVPENLDLSNDALLKNLDQESIRSLNGARVAEQLLKLVPNKENFCTTLRAIKKWAKAKGIYSNAFGFFGGITWAILTARACQLYPNASPSRLVQKVFFVFATWKWPSPVLLQHFSPATGSSLDSLVWNPRINYTDRFHLMPILTPAYPEQNSTHNVSKSTLNVIKEELKLGLEIANKIHSGECKWEDLFEERNFFTGYKHFVALTLDAPAESTYNGFLESKIRQLVQILERNSLVTMAHVNPKRFEKTGSVWFIGLEFLEHAKNLDLTSDIERFKRSIAQQAQKVKNLGEESFDVVYVKRSELIKYVGAADLKRGKAKEVKPSESRKRVATSDVPAAKRNF